TQLHMELTTLENDLKQAETEMDHSLSLLSINLNNNKHEDATFWRLVRQQYAWKLYNFEDDLERKRVVLQSQGIYSEDRDAQKEKLFLLLQICGGFERDDETEKWRQVDRVLTENSDYALTFDNILKIVAIFFRIKAGIP
ncbi:hypothetical protein RFI_30892, partial [Reticulomyxa filosa]